MKVFIKTRLTFWTVCQEVYETPKISKLQGLWDKV